MTPLIFEKYILSKKGLDFKEVYKEFLKDFSENYTSGSLKESKRIRSDMDDEITFYFLPFYNETNKLPIGNFSLIAEPGSNTKSLLDKINSKGYSLEKLKWLKQQQELRKTEWILRF